MKKLMFVALALLGGTALTAVAADEAANPAPVTLSAIEPAAVKDKMAATQPAGQVAYAKTVMKQIAALPVDQEAKSKAFSDATGSLVAGTATATKVDVMGALFATVPVEYIRSVADTLAPAVDSFRRTQTPEAYDDLANRVISATSDAIKADGADAPIARLTVVTSLFTRGAAAPDEKVAQYAGALPEDKQLRDVVAAWVPEVLAGDYSKIAAAVGVEEVVTPPPAGESAKPPLLVRSIYDGQALLSDTLIETDQMFGLKVPTGLSDARVALDYPDDPGIGVPGALPPPPDTEPPEPPVPPPPYRGQRTGGF